MNSIMHKQSWRCIAAHLFFICASYLFPLFLPLNTLPCLVLFLFSLPLTITCSWPSVWASDSSLFLSLSLQTITLTQFTPSLSSLLHVLQFFICSLLSLWATDSSHSLSLSFSISLSLSPDFYLFLTLSMGLRQHSTVSLIRSCDGSPVTLFRACFSFSYADSRAIILCCKTNSSPSTLWNLLGGNYSLLTVQFTIVYAFHGSDSDYFHMHAI